MKLVLFDFNGTLVDDNIPFWQAVVKVFMHHGVIPPTIEEYFIAMEGHWLDVYHSKGIKGNPAELNTIYGPIYFELFKNDMKPFPDIHQVLEELRRREFTIGIISAGIGTTNAPALDALGLTEFFDPQFVEFDNHSKSEAIVRFCQKANIEKSNCYYIGDAPSDIAQSNSTGVQSVAFLSGFIPEHLVCAKNPTHVIYKMSELLNIIK